MLFLISGHISVFSFLKMFSSRVVNFNHHFYLSLHWISVCTDQAASFSFFFLEVFIGRKEYRIVLSDTDMQINNTETWKSVNYYNLTDLTWHYGILPNWLFILTRV